MKWNIQSLHSNNSRQHNDIWFGIIEKLKLLCKQYSSIQCILEAIKKDIIDCDEHAVVCIIDDVMNTFLGRRLLQSGGGPPKGDKDTKQSKGYFKVGLTFCVWLQIHTW